MPPSTRRPPNHFRDLEDLLARVASLERALVSDGWRYIGDTGEPAFQNGWVNFSASINGACYRRIGDMIYLRGAIKNGTVGYATPAFVLGAGYISPEECEHDVSVDGGVGRVYVGSANASGGSTAGRVSVFSGSNVYVDLSSVFYSVI